MRVWTEEEDEYLKSQYGNLTYNEMAQFLERSPGAVRTRVYNLNLSKKKRGPKPPIASKPWTATEIDYLKANIRDKKYKEMDFLTRRGRTPNAIQEKSKDLKLGVNKRQPWTKEEDNFILEKYSDDVPYKEIQKELPNRTVIAIRGRMKKLLSMF